MVSSLFLEVLPMEAEDCSGNVAFAEAEVGKVGRSLRCLLPQDSLILPGALFLASLRDPP